MFDPGTFALGFMAGILLCVVLFAICYAFSSDAPKHVERSDYDLQRFTDE